MHRLLPILRCRRRPAYYHPGLFSTRLGRLSNPSFDLRPFHTNRSVSNELPAATPPIEPTTSFPDASRPAPIKRTIWFDNIFPIRYWKYDPRWIWVRKYAYDAAKAANARLIPTTFPHEFRYLGATPNWKEGGLFVHFSYEGGSVDEVVESIKAHIEKRGLRSWMNLQMVRVFPVKGSPWVDDMIGRLPSEVVKVEFNGPDVSIEGLYKEFRPYGKIVDITLQPPNVKDLPRYALVEYMRVRSATSARNCLNGEKIENATIRISYERRRRTWESTWNWIASHPRITVPVLLGLLAGLTYVVFDPVRVFFITNQLTGRFSLEKYTGAAEQLWTTTASTLGSIWGHKQREVVPPAEAWTERQADLARLQHHLRQTPDTVVLVTGPKGSGKSQLVRKALEHSKYKLVIHVEDLAGQPPHIMLNRLAAQINFKPMFNWLVQMSSMIDTMITATTGAKAGLSTTNEGQVRKMLELLSASVTRITMKQKQARDKILAEQRLHQRMEEHGGGIMPAKAAAEQKEVIAAPVPDVEYPVIVIDGFLGNETAKNSMIYDLLVEWAAVAAEYHLAHVILISDNPTAVKTISKAMPNKTIEMVSLSDASPDSALSVVRRRLGEAVNDEELKQCVEGLGGRLTDLELLIQKIRAGMSPNDAYLEIVLRAVSEIRKLGLGEDVGDQKSLQWTPVQFWKIVQLLSKHDEVLYDQLRFHPLFKGDESPLQAMERAGLIMLSYDNGRPYSLRASRPVYRRAFSQMLTDEGLSAIMGIMTTKQLIADEEENIRKCTAEMNNLNPLAGNGTVKREVNDRLDYLTKALGGSVQKVKALSDEQAKYKNVVKLVE
ncbi:uncharacterized protein SPPG_03960 [Spizellomyces punctatus DAOM BR117]|uniref:Mitochondrial escape protein 2 n=1 Tax=Spizellomyces punctatus (strain DAOM BR117) TaxID=645134 RepID=A0A0L0HHB3_SPIPD|nr:uncharacterized protein SPPG_03960 [Spizellomyces punctatus DAOM BR117]KND00856.1 hypothetical protein SPPG_03960 [Spizellomyces punctatus DAOM BR117]|eukprot:XP_016608895.1 hypothetical protein SPPG_03960 [Spizellomyces punctatus DAOM BR117]